MDRRLCLIQDDRNDQKMQLGHMRKIYANDDLCVVAASGDSARLGIPGLSSPRRTQVEIPLPRHDMNAPQSFPTRSHAAIINGFTWSKRDWESSSSGTTRSSSPARRPRQPKAHHLKHPLIEITFDKPIDSSLLLTYGHVAMANYGLITFWTWLVYCYVQMGFSFAGDGHDTSLGALENLQGNHDIEISLALLSRDSALHPL